MRKFVSLFLLLGVMMGTLPLAAVNAQDDATSFGALAALFPEDTPLFVSVRTDDAVTEILDRLLRRLAASLPPDTLPAESLFDLRDELARELSGGTGDFASTVGVWLGDTAALGILEFEFDEFGELEDEPPILFAIEITDFPLAADFLQRSLLASAPPNTFQVRIRPDRVTIAPRDDTGEDPTVIITEDTVLIGTADAIAAVNEMTVSLADNDAFNASFGSLPAENYLAAMFLDTGALLAPLLAAASEDPEFPDFIADLFGVIGAQALGLTLLGDDTLVIDLAQTMGDSRALEALGLPTEPVVFPPLDPDFAAFIPQGSQLVVQGTDLQTTVLKLFEGLDVLGVALQDILAEQIEAGEIEPEAAFLTQINLGRSLVTFTNLAFSGATGLNLQKDVLAWMTGDYATYARARVGKGGTGLLIDAGLVVETDDANATRRALFAVEDALEQYGFESRFAVDEAGGITFELPGLFGSVPLDLDGVQLDPASFDVLFGVNDEVFAVGTRAGVEEALDPLSEGLLADAAYTSAAAYFLDGAGSAVFVNLAELLPFVVAFAPPDPDLEMGLEVLGLFDSAAISMTAAADGSSVVRLALTPAG